MGCRMPYHHGRICGWRSTSETMSVACNRSGAGGVHIGNNVVIGAGSVVTKDIPDGYLAFGNPCKPVRPITEADSKKDLILPEDRKHFEYNLM